MRTYTLSSLPAARVIAGGLAGLLVACVPGGGGAETTSAATGAGTTSTSGTSSGSGSTASVLPTAGPSTSETGASSASAFVPDPDIGSANECDLFLQDCPMGQKCVPCSIHGQGWDVWRCAAINPAGHGVGEACTVDGCDDDCDAASVCTFAYPANAGDGVCTALCGGALRDPTCTDPDATCLLASNFVDAVCSLPCDPLSPSCPDGLECRYFRGVFTCHVGADEPYGARCDNLSDGTCQEGLACISAAVPGCASSSCCTSLCDLGDPMASEKCPDFLAGQTCEPFEPDGGPVPGAEGVGVCAM